MTSTRRLSLPSDFFRGRSKSTAEPYQMTEETLQERIKKVNAGRFFTQAFAGIAASVSSISFGTVLGWSSPAIRIAVDKDYKGEASLDATFDLSWVASLGPLGCAIGVPVWSYFNVKFGPKTTMLIHSPCLLLTWLSIIYVEETRTVTYKNLRMELVMRFFCGFFAISYRICGETLLQDTVHKHYLKRFVVMYRSFVLLGVLLTYIMGYSISERSFAFTNCGIILIHLAMLLICPESPVYLYDKNLKKAEKSLSWYRGKSNIYVEMRNIKRDSDIRKLDPGAYKYMLYSKVVVKAIAITVMVTFGQVVSCYYMFLYYNPVIIKAKVSGQKLEDFEIGALDDFISRNVDAIILASNMFISHLLSTWVHYRLIFGLKKPLMLSCSLVTIVLFMTCIYLHFSEGEFMLIYERNNWIYQTLANLLIIGFELGLSTAPDVMLTDYTPNQVFPRAKLIVKLTQWLLIFIATKTFFQISAQLYGSGAFTIYAVLSLCICIASGIFVVESKGKTLVQVQTDIGGNPIGSRGIYNRKLTISNESPEANEAMLIG